jgi:hypothetical protein
MERPAKISDQGKSQALSKSKGIDFLKRAAQDAMRQRLRNKPGAALGSTSKPKDLKIKSDEHSASRHSDAKLQVDQTLWQKQRPNNRRTPHSHQRPLNAAPQSWWSLQRSKSASHLGERPYAGRPKVIPVLVGGSDPEDSTSRQQGEESSNFSSKQIKDQIDRMNRNKENKSESYNRVLEAGKEAYQEAKEREQYERYTKKHGGTKHYR